MEGLEAAMLNSRLTAIVDDDQPYRESMQKPKSATRISKQDKKATKSDEFLLRRAVRNMGKTASLQLYFISWRRCLHQLM
jgi:hypothetical protein